MYIAKQLKEKSIAEVRADLPVSVFTFADEESWDRCQAMIEMAISRNRKPPAGRNKEPPAGRNEEPPAGRNEDPPVR